MITGYVSGDTAVSADLRGLPARARTGLAKGLGRIALKLQAKVQREKLTGQVLKVKTGTLRRSVEQLVKDSGDSVLAVVSSNLSYARTHEFGFNGTASVKEHVRTIKQAFGKSIAPTQVNVKSHSRNVDLPERSFLRTSLRELDSAGVIKEEITKAIGVEL